MSLFTSIGHFFGSLFGKNGDLVQTVLHEVSAVATLADPIVQQIELELKPLVHSDPAGIAAHIESFLGRYEPDVIKAGAAARQLSTLPIADLLHNVAVFALQALVPESSGLSMLNLAVEIAYNVLKHKLASRIQTGPLAPPDAEPEPVATH